MRTKDELNSGVTIGIDLGDKKHAICVLDRDGEIQNSGTGEMHPSSASHSRDELVEALASLGGILKTRLDAGAQPWRLSLSLDYDEVWCYPERDPNT